MLRFLLELFPTYLSFLLSGFSGASTMLSGETETLLNTDFQPVLRGIASVAVVASSLLSMNILTSNRD